MRRLLQVRLLFVLIALLLVPALALPFADRLRTEWTRYWEPKAKPIDDSRFIADPLGQEMYAGTGVIGDMTIYPAPVLPAGCLFQDAPDDAVEEAVDADDFPATETDATREALLRAMEQFEPMEFDEFDLQPMLSLPTEEYWAELKAREARRKAAKP